MVTSAWSAFVGNRFINLFSPDFRAPIGGGAVTEQGACQRERARANSDDASRGVPEHLWQHPYWSRSASCVKRSVTPWRSAVETPAP